MKRKAIAELEILAWLGNTLHSRFGSRLRSVKKSGGDAHLWFSRFGGITRDPDFVCHLTEETRQIEFQYADKPRADYYDFKLSKIAPKRRGRREPRTDLEILLILKDPARYVFLSPPWVANHGFIAEVPAWRTDAYRVPASLVHGQVTADPTLEPVLRSVDLKNALLEFQHSLFDEMSEELSVLLQTVVDENQLVSIVPETLDGFFQVCFILMALGKEPKNKKMWLSYLTSFVDECTDARRLFSICFPLTSCIFFFLQKSRY
jgi:hypothetical protein